MAKAADEPKPAAAEEPRPAAAEEVSEGAGAAPANYATLRGPVQRLGEFFFASVEDGESDDDDEDGSVNMSTWTPEEIAGFNKVCVRRGLGIRYTS
jgi:hypothetical protein